MNKWAMSMIEDNSATPSVPNSVRAWMESSKHGEDEKSRNTINVHLDREKSTIEHMSSNVPCPVENVVCAQPSVSHEEDEIQIQILIMCLSSVDVKILKRMTGNQQPKELKRS